MEVRGLEICDAFMQPVGDRELPMTSRFMFVKRTASSTSPAKHPSTSTRKFFKTPKRSYLSQRP
jgi:hypothetical protein